MAYPWANDLLYHLTEVNRLRMVAVLTTMESAKASKTCGGPRAIRATPVKCLLSRNSHLKVGSSLFGGRPRPSYRADLLATDPALGAFQ